MIWILLLTISSAMTRTAKAQTCLRIRCEDPSHDPNMQVSCSDEYWYDSTCKFNCLSGYQFSGHPTATCWGDGCAPMGQWFHRNEIWSAKCIRIRCEDPSHDPNMKISCSDSNWYDSTCNFNCSKGYVLNGYPTAICWSNGKVLTGQWLYENKIWSAECLRIRCEDPSHDPNMQIFCSDEHWYDSNCNFNCSYGYELKGHPTATCWGDENALVGQWFHENEIWSAQCLPATCDAINKTGVVQIHPKPFVDGGIEVYCEESDHVDDLWIVIQRRINGSVDFYRKYDEYVEGFGNKNGEFWFGLENIHQLTAAAEYDILIELEDFDGNTAYQTYSNFFLGNSTEKYILHLENPQGTAGSALIFNKVGGGIGRKFSTYDSDNDNSINHCAERFHGAWWYNHCHQANLNGKYYTSALIRKDGIVWKQWKNKYVTLKAATMKIRRK